ncbi:MAG: IS66 family transposase [Cyanobacteria bacterium REEB67]|nr:IS66 family transposase [Cyanobacteria bacterium REEB67]
MIKELRTKLISTGAPKKLLAEYEAAIRADAEAPLWKKLQWAEHLQLDYSDAVATWRDKYFLEKEKAERLALTDSLRLARIQELEDQVARQSAQIVDLQKLAFAETSERKKKPATEASTGDNESTSPTTAPKRGKKHGAKGHGRKKDKNLPPEPMNHDISECDKVCGCGGEFELIDLPPKESFETHLHQQGVLRIHRRRTVKRRCKSCGKEAKIKTAPKPGQLIPRGKYSVDFWNFVIEEKYWLQRPLNRVKQRLAAFSIDVGLGTLTNALSLLHERRIFEVIYEAILERSKLDRQRNMDETGWKVFAESEGKNSNNWYMWVAVTSDATVFILDPRRSSEVIAEHLRGVAEGIIIADRYSAYKAFSKKSKFTIAFCWIHQRRDFIKLRDGYPKHAVWAQSWIDRIDVLMAQNKIRVAALGDAAKFTAPDDMLRTMVTQMKAEIDAQLKEEGLAKECRDELESLIRHWTGLTVFVNNPLVPMDNNAAERALREAVLGRKSYYGNRSVWSGQLSSHLFTIYATLEQNGINPHEWMFEYLTACANNNGLPPPDRELKKFFPWNYKSRKEQKVETSPISDQPTSQEITVSLLPEPQLTHTLQ